jgi:tetratricopeptide (TPR) repeat protein
MRLRVAIVALVSCLTATLSTAEPVSLLPGLANEKLNQAVKLLGEGNLKQADVILQEVLQKDPSQVYALFGRAQIAMSDGRLTDAERGVNSILKSQNELPEAHSMKGVVLLLQKRPDEARTAFLRAIELRPSLVIPRFYLGAIARGKGDYVEAVAQYKALTQTAPGVAAGYLGQAEAQVMLRNIPEAFRILQSWKTVPGSGSTPYHVIANVYLAERDPAKAVEELRLALAKNPGNSVTLTYLGDAQLASKDTAHAIESYRLAIKADAKNAIAHNNLAWVLAERDADLTEALRLAEIATTLEPAYEDAHDTLGWVLYKRNEYGKAVDALTKARKLAPNRMDIAAHLGLAYAKAGSRAQALTELRAVLASKTPLPNRAELERVVGELASAR